MHSTLPVVNPSSMVWHHAIAISYLAAHNEAVFSRLATGVAAADFRTTTQFPTVKPTPFLVPSSLEQADRTIEWLITTLSTKPSHHAHQLLGTVATYESPKALILGIIGFATPFIDFGLITSKKKKKSELSVIISEKWYRTQSNAKIAQFIATRGLEQVSRELRSANGQLVRLHPETFDWLTNDRETSIYLADHNTLSELRDATMHEQLPSHQTNCASQLVSLTLSPQVNDTFLPQFMLTRAN